MATAVTPRNEIENAFRMGLLIQRSRVVLQDLLSTQLQTTYPGLFDPSNGGKLFDILTDQKAKHTLLNLKKKNVLNASQMNLLYPSGNPCTSVTLNDLDVTLTVVLLRNITALNPKGSWENPPIADTSMEALIGRVKKYHNKFSDGGASLRDAAFQTQFTELKALFLSLSTFYTSDDYDMLLTDPLHAAVSEAFCELISTNLSCRTSEPEGRVDLVQKILKHDENDTKLILLTGMGGIDKEKNKRHVCAVIGDSQLFDIPVVIFSLRPLKIFHFNSNAFTTLLITVCGLTNLEVLNLSGNQLSDIPVDITRLTNIKRLDLDNNNITHLPPGIRNMEILGKLNVRHNPLLQPPKDTVNRGLGAMKRYFEALTDTKAIQSSRNQVNLLGETEAGKTSLSCTLQLGEPNPTKMADRTRVVEQGTWVYDQDIGFNINDFGGHNVYNILIGHHIFISTSVFVYFTFDLSEYDPENEAHYQLNIGNCIDKMQEQMTEIQVALIGTHLDEVETPHAERKSSAIIRQLEDHVSEKKWYQAQKKTTENKIKEISEAQVSLHQAYQRKAAHLQTLYGQMKPIYEQIFTVSSNTFEGVQELRDNLISFARTSTIVLPEMWVNAAKKIFTKKIEGTENTLGWEVFEDRILQNMSKMLQEKNEKMICDILSFLAHHGGKKWFDRSLSLMKVVVHKKEVPVNVLEAVLTHDQVEVSQMLQKSMKITRKKAPRIEEDIFSRGIIPKQALDCLCQSFSLSSTEVDVMTEMMLKLELCYQVQEDESLPSNTSFHFPWLLTRVRQPELDTKWPSKVLPDTTQLTLQVPLPYRCPDGLYEKFPVRQYRHLRLMKTMLMDWKDEELEQYKMQLTRGPHQSNSDTVSQDPDWVISIAAHGSHLSDTWDVLTQGHNDLMDIIKEDWPGLSYDKYLVCPHCVSEDSQDPTLFPGEILDQSHGMAPKARQVPRFNTDVYIPADLFYPLSWQEGVTLNLHGRKEIHRGMDNDLVMNDEIDWEEKSYRKPVQVEDEADNEEIINHVDGPVIDDVSQVTNSMPCTIGLIPISCSVPAARKEARAAVEKTQKCRDKPMWSTIFEADDSDRIDNTHKVSEVEPYPVTAGDKDQECDSRLKPLREIAAMVVCQNLEYIEVEQEICLTGQYVGSCLLSRRQMERGDALEEDDPEEHHNGPQGVIIIEDLPHVVQKVNYIDIHEFQHSDDKIQVPANSDNRSHAPTDSIMKTMVDMLYILEDIEKVLGSPSTLPAPRSKKRSRKRRTGGKTVRSSDSLVSCPKKRIQKKGRVCTKRQRKKKKIRRKYGVLENRGILMKMRKRNMELFATGKEKPQFCQTSNGRVQITKGNCTKGMLEVLQLFCMNFPENKHEEMSKAKLIEKSPTNGLPGDFFKYYSAFVPKQYRHIFVYPASLNEYFLRLAQGPAFLQGEENKYEAVRLASFRAWPQWAPVAATRLARSGFYYSGNGDEVVCFSCGGHHRQWSHGDNPMDQHRLRFPDCRFVRGSDTENVPLVPGVALRDSSSGTDPFPNLGRSGSHVLLGGDLASQQALQQSLGFPNQDVLVQSLNSIGTSTSEISQLRGPANDSFSHYQHLAGTIGGGLDERDNDRSPAQTAGTFTQQSTEMKSEAARLRTFAHWPISAHVRPHDLAKAGFFYTGNADSVQCAFCSGILRNWDPGDRPMQEHRHHFPTCPFALGVDVGNIALEPDQANLPSAIQESLVTSSATGGTATTLGGNFYRGDDLGILTERPKHERFAVESTRLATFSHWTSHNTQKPEVLAKAGFFYAGFADNVKCFFCDGGLRNWERGDDPWTEHARWFPRCGFVKQCKGEDFIRDVQAKHPPQYPPNQPRPAIATPLPAQSSPAVARPPGQFPVEPREIKARLDTPTVQAVLEMGCSRTVVRAAIEDRLRTVGDDFPNAESLLEAIFQIEESMNREESQSSAGGVPEPAQPPREQQPPRDTRNTNTTTQTKKKTEEKKNKKKKDKKGAGATLGPPGDKDEEAKSLMEENLRLKEQRTCKICMDEDVSVVFLPCGHLVACTQCAPALRNCPICRAIIRGTVRTFLS